MDNTAVVGVWPAPHVIAGRLSSEDQRLIFDWVGLNAAAIIGYWDGDIDTAKLIQTLQRLPPRP